MIEKQEIVLLLILFGMPIIIWLLQPKPQIIIQDSCERKRICPACNFQNDKDAKFCNNCGSKF